MEGREDLSVDVTETDCNICDDGLPPGLPLPFDLQDASIVHSEPLLASMASIVWVEDPMKIAAEHLWSRDVSPIDCEEVGKQICESNLHISLGPTLMWNEPAYVYLEK